MAYLIPPSVVEFQLTTNAAANTFNSNIAIIAAPGAGLALRIVGWHLMGTRGNTGNINVFVHGAGGFVVCEGAVSVGGDTGAIPEPGITIATNTALQLDNVSNVGAQTFRIIIYYFTQQN